MDTAETYRFINNSLNPFYAEYSFVPMTNVAGYTRVVNEEIRQICYLGANISKFRIGYTPYFLVEHKTLMETVNRLMGKDIHVVRGDQEEYLAMRFQVTGYHGFFGYSVRELAHADHLVQHHKAFMHEVGMKFFEQTISLEGIHRYLNERVQPDAFKHITELDRRRMPQYGEQLLVNGIVTAWLLKDPRFDAIVNAYRQIFHMQYFQDIINTLMNAIEKQPQPDQKP